MLQLSAMPKPVCLSDEFISICTTLQLQAQSDLPRRRNELASSSIASATLPARAGTNLVNWRLHHGGFRDPYWPGSIENIVGPFIALQLRFMKANRSRAAIRTTIVVAVRYSSCCP